MTKKRGQQTLVFSVPPGIQATAAIAGPKEGEGLLGSYYDKVMEDNLSGQDNWEKCESYMMEWAVKTVVQKSGLLMMDIDFLLAGDLLNQLIATNFAMRGIGRPFLGLYGACSTMAESMLIGAMMLDGGFANHIVAAVSSHHDTAERQYRYPTELGVQRPLIAQWTITASGAVVLQAESKGPKITSATIGKVVDFGVKDTNSMGPAMAPAAVDTLWQHFQDTGRQADYYDMIYTGDLGKVGKELVIRLMKERGMDISNNYEDCGCMIYREDQDAHSGASGCASSAAVLCAYLYPRLVAGHLKKILFIGTGSLHSTTSYQQKESIPCIAHAVAVEI
ncbi:MAG: spoVAD [Firmicutes bacterium]|nr:spoVAD [Bacillota bacterium]